jgi:hypothetical protein
MPADPGRAVVEGAARPPGIARPAGWPGIGREHTAFAAAGRAPEDDEARDGARARS